MSGTLRYRGHNSHGSPVIGATPATTTPAAFAETKHRAGWRDLTITRDDDEVGGIARDPNSGARVWWGEPS